MEIFHEFFLSMIPPTSTAQEKGFNRKTGNVYLKPKAADARAKLRARLAKHAPPEPVTGAIALDVVWCFPIKGNHKRCEPKITRPDIDNLQKALKDVMTELVFWLDDAAVSAERVRKIYSDYPGIMITISRDEGIRRNNDEP